MESRDNFNEWLKQEAIQRRIEMRYRYYIARMIAAHIDHDILGVQLVEHSLFGKIKLELS